jgi:hypothetical protein
MKKCIWCFKSEKEVNFDKKAHTIPISLGGQNYNKNVCDSCNYYFGDRKSNNGKYSIEVALKEAFGISRYRFLSGKPPKKQVGRFKSQFFDILHKDGGMSLVIKDSYSDDSFFQFELGRSFRRGLMKMYLEELNRQTGTGYEKKFDWIRSFARYDNDDLPVIYFRRKHPLFVSFLNENETPKLIFNRMTYLYSNETFVEMEFLGHTFGFPIDYYTKDEWNNYVSTTKDLKKDFFEASHFVEKLSDIDIALHILDM